MNIEIPRKLIDCGKALQSQTVIQDCKTTILREVESFGAEIEYNPFSVEDELSFDFSVYSGLSITVDCVSDEKLYTKLMSDNRTVIASLDKIECCYTIEQVLVGYDTSLKIRFNFSCPLPESDLYTLEMLGKVKTEHHSSNNSYTTQHIMCDI